MKSKELIKNFLLDLIVEAKSTEKALDLSKIYLKDNINQIDILDKNSIDVLVDKINKATKSKEDVKTFLNLLNSVLDIML